MCLGTGGHIAPGMASIFERPGSRFWWVKYRDPGTGKIQRKSTGIDKVLPDARRKAKGVAAKWTTKEMAAPRTREAERWETWARPYLDERYKDRGSLKNAILSLGDLMVYFQEKEIRTPRQVTHDIVSAFVPWRLSNKTLVKVKKNTALLRFVYFRILMGEAVRRGFAEFNLCRDAEHEREASKEKLEISEADQKKIESELLTKPQWMQDQWLVLMRQGCRVAETGTPMERIDEKAMTITLRLKGGWMHTAALHPDLLPMVARARSEGRKALIEGPPSGSWPAIWSDFFKRRKLPYSIHCTRVTVITRLARAGASVVDICNFIGHSQEVNRIYRKLKPADSLSLLSILAGAPTPSTDSEQP